MILHGYCTECHRPRRVCVARFVPGGIQQGVCAQCEDDNDNKQRGKE